jgi:signal recognition particle GTPase
LSGRVLSKDFNLKIFLSQIRQMKKMGPLASITKWLPGVGNFSITPEKKKNLNVSKP